MSKHRKKIPYTSLERQLTLLIQEADWQGAVGVRGSDLRFLLEAPLDHNTRKCSGKHCRDCSIMPSFKSLTRQVGDVSMSYLKTDEADRILGLTVADAPAAVSNKSHSLTGTVPCTGDNCLLCTSGQYSILSKDARSKVHLAKIPLTKTDPMRGQFRKEEDRDFVEGRTYTYDDGTPLPEGMYADRSGMLWDMNKEDDW